MELKGHFLLAGPWHTRQLNNQNRSRPESQPPLFPQHPLRILAEPFGMGDFQFDAQVFRFYGFHCSRQRFDILRSLLLPANPVEDDGFAFYPTDAAVRSKLPLPVVVARLAKLFPFDHFRVLEKSTEISPGCSPAFGGEREVMPPKLGSCCAVSAFK